MRAPLSSCTRSTRCATLAAEFDVLSRACTVRVRWPAAPIPHFQFGRFAMALFSFLLPVLIVFGDIAWFVHVVLVIGTASKVQLAWHLWNREELPA